MRKELMEIGALEFMKQFKAQNRGEWLTEVTLLISILSERDAYDANQSSASWTCIDVVDPILDIKNSQTSNRPWLHSIQPRQLISSPYVKSSCVNNACEQRSGDCLLLK